MHPSPCRHNQPAAVGSLPPERTIPPAILRGAAGLAVLSVARVGAGWSLSVGSGLVVARTSEGGWSAPSALLSLASSVGWQLGLEVQDLVSWWGWWSLHIHVNPEVAPKASSAACGAASVALLLLRALHPYSRPPSCRLSFIKVHQTALPFLFQVLVLRSDSALKAFCSSQLGVGGALSIAAGPVSGKALAGEGQEGNAL